MQNTSTWLNAVFRVKTMFKLEPQPIAKSHTIQLAGETILNSDTGNWTKMS